MFFKFLKNLILTLLLCMIATSCNQFSVRQFNVNTLKKISNLSTLECHFKNVSVYTKDGIFGPERQILEYTATINIGIDMKNVRYDNITKTLSIPRPKVVSKNYDSDSIKSITDKYLIFSNLNVEEAQLEISKSLNELVEKVENNTSIMNRAQNLAATQIDAMIRNMFMPVPKINYSFD